MSDEAPHIKDGPAPLRYLINRALYEFGEFSPDTIEADVAIMLIDFANEIVEDILSHPYATKADSQLDYYESLDDAREIHDQIMRTGLLARFLRQQGSERFGMEMSRYYRTMNQIMWRRLNGNTPIRMRQVGDGTNPSYAQTNKTNPINGLKG